MKLPIHLIGLFVAASVQAGTTKPNPAVPVIPVVPEIQLPQSVFAIPSQPSEGRNPFFPQSTFGFQAPTVAVRPSNDNNAVDTSAFILNGITSPPKRTAMINGRTFEPGESGEVRLPNGARALIKCEEIRSESAVILVNGVRREVKFRTGL
jgi:hypothetical protein